MLDRSRCAFPRGVFGLRPGRNNLDDPGDHLDRDRGRPGVRNHIRDRDRDRFYVRVRVRFRPNRVAQRVDVVCPTPDWLCTLDP